MNRLLIALAFLLGASAVLWVGVGFVGTDALALTVTMVIGGVYTLGFIELLQFRQATASLSHALGKLSATIEDLEQWLNTLHPSLQNSVRLRIEGQRVGLPAPVLTPYLVGLLVMLGLLGTFVGMVDTLKGAVLALEGSTELQAIRAGLAAPINGLGLSFGTSVAGVAASAMLGLISTLSRRDRMLETRLLDNKIASVFKGYSLAHNQQETFKALQIQAQALPGVAEKLHLLTDQLGQMSDNLSDKLIANQEAFNDSVKDMYAGLASSVDASLQVSLAESGRLAGESIKPIVERLMTEIREEVQSSVQSTHQQLSDTVQEQLKVISAEFSATSTDVTSAWNSGLSEYQCSNEALAKDVKHLFEGFSGQLAQSAGAILDSFDSSMQDWASRQELSDKTKLEHLTASLEQVQKRATTQLEDVSVVFADKIKQTVDSQQQAFKAVTEDFESMSTTAASEWQKAGEQTVSQHKDLSSSMESVANSLTDNLRLSATGMVGEIGDLIRATEHLVETRVRTEEMWLDGHSDRVDSLVTTLKNELTALRADEERRGEAAVERLAGLESVVAAHLGKLGKALEEPMTNLIRTASETPRAAAEVIGQLRQEISNNIERDNSLLEERQEILERLNDLSASLEQSSVGQQEAVEVLVKSSETMLESVGSQFTQQVGEEASKFSSIADNFASSAIELSSLGESFSLAVHLFNESNGNLIENLTRIEESLDKSTSRSDEQLGYYVAQAREIIDHSILSQKEIFEELRQLSQKDELLPAEVN